MFRISMRGMSYIVAKIVFYRKNIGTLKLDVNTEWTTPFRIWSFKEEQIAD